MDNEPVDAQELAYTRMDGSDTVFTFVDIKTRNKIEELESDFSTIIDDSKATDKSVYSSEKVESIKTELDTNLKKYVDDFRTIAENDISSINGKIPSQASVDNQLADKDFVNSTVATETSNFKGTFETLEELKEVSPVTNNDYGYVVTIDDDGNTVYKRYKYSSKTKEWLWEYDLNNSSFTAEEWAAIKSGITAAKVAEYNQAVIDATRDAAIVEKLEGDSSVKGSVDNKIKNEFDTRAIPKHWFGTQSQYDELTEKEDGVLYFIKRDE